MLRNKIISFFINRIDDSRLINSVDEYLPPAWQHVIVWGGLHGGLSMVLALSLEQGFPQREFLLSTVFGVVFLSLIIQGTTMSGLINLLGLGKKRRDYELNYEMASAEMLCALAGEKELERLLDDRLISKKVYNKFKKEITLSKEKSESRFENLFDKFPELEKTQVKDVRKALLTAQKSSILGTAKTGLLSDTVRNEVLAKIDKDLLDLSKQSN